MPTRRVFLLSPIFLAALVPAASHRAASALSEPGKVGSPPPATRLICAENPGTRCARLAEDQLPAKCSKNNKAPVAASFKASKSLVYLPADCPAGAACAEGGATVELAADVKDPDGDAVVYTYTTTGGRIKGDGPNVTWDLTGLAPGTYTASVEFDDRCGCVGFSTITVTVERCSCESAAK